MDATLQQLLRAGYEPLALALKTLPTLSKDQLVTLSAKIKLENEARTSAWVTRAGEVLKIRDIDDLHLYNILHACNEGRVTCNKVMLKTLLYEAKRRNIMPYKRVEAFEIMNRAYEERLKNLSDNIGPSV